MSRDKAETVPKRWNIHLRENLKADHYPKNTSCKQRLVVQKEYLPTKLLIVFLFLSFSSIQEYLFRGWRWGFGGGWVWCLILILALLWGLPGSLTPLCPGTGAAVQGVLSQRVCAHMGNHLDCQRSAVWGHTQSLFEHPLPNSGSFEQGIYRVLPLLPQPLFDPEKGFCVKKQEMGCEFQFCGIFSFAVGMPYSCLV